MEVKRLKIAVCGHTTPGKRLICNGLLGREIIQEADRDANNASCVNNIPYVPNRFMEITVCDVHGFDENFTADQYVTEVRDNCQDADLLLYCIKVSDHRFVRDRRTLMQLMTCFEYSSVWDHCIFVLIFPDPIVFMGNNNMNPNYDNENIAYWTKKFKEVHRDIGISNRPNILPAGDAIAFSLLNNRKYWLSDLYAMAKGLVGEIQRDVLVQLNIHRCIIKSEIKINSFDGDITRQPIVVSNDPDELRNVIAVGLCQLL